MTGSRAASGSLTRSVPFAHRPAWLTYPYVSDAPAAPALYDTPTISVRSDARMARRPDHRPNRFQPCPPLLRSFRHIAAAAQTTPMTNGRNGPPAEIRSGPSV